MVRRARSRTEQCVTQYCPAERAARAMRQQLDACTWDRVGLHLWFEVMVELDDAAS